MKNGVLMAKKKTRKKTLKRKASKARKAKKSAKRSAPRKSLKKTKGRRDKFSMTWDEMKESKEWKSDWDDDANDFEGESTEY